MIRALRTADIDRVSEIWLRNNTEVHDYIPARYWQDALEPVKGMLAQGEVYVYEGPEGRIEGFIGLEEEHIEGIFVERAARSGGIGRQLMDHAKGLRSRLSLNVYQRNVRAVRFYEREGFQIQCEHMDETVGQAEHIMVWERDEPSSL